MIPEEQIKQLAVSCGFKLTNETGDDLKPYVYKFARELIAMAQQVKPLEFERQKDGTLLARHPLGYYEVFRYEERYKKGYTGFSFENHCLISEVVETEAEAIAAAQQDYQRRVLSCLVNGGE